MTEGGINTPEELAEALRRLRRREARRQGQAELTYREIAARTGWSIGIIGAYFTGKAIPPTDRFDILVTLLGATPAERGLLATARDRVTEDRRKRPKVASARAAAPPAAPPARKPAPNQLPAVLSSFTGRVDELCVLDRLLVHQAEAGRVVVVSGAPGVGKTTLVVHWAHRAAAGFPDGLLYVNLRGFDPDAGPVLPEEAIRAFLRAMDVPPHRIPTGTDELTAFYRAELADRRLLLVLDNARDTSQVRPLLPGSPSAAVVVTSRHRLPGLVVSNGAHLVSLDLMSARESRALLSGRLGAARVEAEPEAADAIIDHCARLPLALAVAAARASTDARLTLTALAGELAEAGQRLNALAVGDTLSDVQTVFSWSYHALSGPAADLFPLLGLHPGPDISAAVAVSLAGGAPADTHRALGQLTAANLLIEHAPHRYAMHDLLRAYAVDLAGQLDATLLAAATTRMLDHYVHTAHAAARLIHEHLDPIPIPLTAPAAGTRPEPVGDVREAAAWFGARRRVLLAVVEDAAGNGFSRHAWQLIWAIDRSLDLGGHWHDLAHAWRLALDAAGRLGEPGAEALSHRMLAVVCTQLGLHDEANHHHQQALDGYHRSGDQLGAARTHRSFANQCWRQERIQEAVRHGERSLALYEAAGDRRGQAFALNDVGWYLVLLGEHDQALARCEQALVLFGALGDRVGQAHAWDSLAHTHHHRGDAERAVESYRRALVLFRDIGDRYEEAATLTRIGDAHQAMDQADRAHAAWTSAWDILRQLHHPDAEVVEAKLRNAKDGR
jgi:tetratricopeptide (TPR) repeat protein